MRVLVIGAGASGLTTAKTLRSRGHEVVVVEGGRKIGGTFENKSYQNARMVSSRYLTQFSDFRRTDAEVHMSLPDYVIYLQEYATHFDLNELIRFGVLVDEVTKTPGGGYEVTMSEVGAQHSVLEKWDAVAVCSGLHNVPRVPVFPGQESFEGEILHSSAYRDPSVFADKRVLVIGTGETAFDLGHAAATDGKAQSVTLSTRHGFVSVPAFFGGSLPPLDCIIMNWATHAWESKWAARVGMHWWITTKFTRLSFLLWTGTTYGFNQWAGMRFNMTWDEGRKHIVNKSSKCMPLISRKLKRQVPWWRRLPWWNIWDQDVEGMDIDLVEGSIAKMNGKTVTYDTAGGVQNVEADIVVLATGYRQRFPFLFSENKDDDALPTEHFVVNPEEPNLAYIGFIRPNVGAIPPMSELQAMWWCEKLEGKLVCQSPDYYKLQGSRLNYGVDYGYYMFALAREMGAIPSLLHWSWRNPRVAFTCAFGQAHVPIFRLEGPFKDAAAEATVAGELFGPIKQRPLFMNAVFVIEAFGLGVLNTLTASFDSLGNLALTTSIAGLLLLQRRMSMSSCLSH